jgi:hypothetical protein
MKRTVICTARAALPGAAPLALVGADAMAAGKTGDQDLQAQDRER